MKKRYTWIIISLMLGIKSLAQTKGGLEQAYYANDGTNFTFVPVAYFQNNDNWYFEGRYNYEAYNTLSVYAGRIFEKDAAVSYLIIPMVGMLAGQYKGGSVGMESEVNYKSFSFSLQSQYTFSFANKKENFFYSWSELGLEAGNHLEGGVSVQHTKAPNEANEFDKGIFFKAKYKQWTIPFYAFLKNDHSKYYILSLNYAWTYKKAQAKVISN